MTSMKKIPKEAGKSAHHNDDVQGLKDGGQKSEVNTLSDSSWILWCRSSWTVERQRAVLRSAWSASLIGDLPDQPWWQATSGVHVGSLGFRSAQSLARLAFIVSASCPDLWFP